MIAASPLFLAASFLFRCRENKRRSTEQKAAQALGWRCEVKFKRRVTVAVSRLSYNT
jgi:hypothetical protein